MAEKEVDLLTADEEQNAAVLEVGGLATDWAKEQLAVLRVRPRFGEPGLAESLVANALIDVAAALVSMSHPDIRVEVVAVLQGRLLESALLSVAPPNEQDIFQAGFRAGLREGGPRG